MSDNGRIVIPAAYRKAMGLKGGDRLTIHMDERGLHIQSRRQALLEAQRIVREFIDPGRSLSAELIAERRLEAKREGKDG